jgi:glycerol-3-phosphate acyltransferase PlsX
MLLALDVMGGDNAPLETCAGAVMACERFTDLELALWRHGGCQAPVG